MEDTRTKDGVPRQTRVLREKSRVLSEGHDAPGRTSPCATPSGPEPGGGRDPCPCGGGCEPPSTPNKTTDSL